MSDTEFDPRDVTGRWDYGQLAPNVHIGNDCWLERKDSLARLRSERNPGLVIGNRVRIYTWATFNVEPSGWIEIGDDCVLVGPVFMCAQHIRLGRRVLVSYNVTIADSDFHPHDPEARIQDAIANSPFGDRSSRPVYVSSPVTIEDDVSIGIGAIILKGVTIGTSARIGAGTVVTRDVPAGATVMGNPARIVEGESTP